MHHRGRWVHPGSLDSRGCGLWFEGYILRGWVHSGARCVYLCSSGVVRFSRVRPKGCWVHPWPLGSLVYALGVVGFIQGGTRVQPGCRRGVWLHTGAPWGSLGLSGVVGVTRLHHGGRSSSCAVGFTRVRASGLRVHPGLLGSLGCALDVAGFIKNRSLHSSTPWVSLGLSGVALGYALAVVGFIPGHGVHSGAP